jgi:amidase
MGGFSDFARYDGLGLAELVRNREVQPIELVEETIARIEAHNPALNAIVYKLYDGARAAARGALAGPFAGVPFLIKDLGVTLDGAPTSEGNRRLALVARTGDSELIARYRKAGLVFVAKTNIPEFGLAPFTEPEAFGPCRNPWDVSRTCGGSSGGSGAAVAARMAPMAHASDGGGSIRIPASCCALVGLKPTRGRTPQGPIVGEAWRGYSINHALTRSVRDCAALLDATQGADVGAPYEIRPPARPYLAEVAAPPGRLRIAFTTAPFIADTIHPDCVAGVSATAALLAELGHEVVEASPPFDRDAWLQALMVILAAETSIDIEKAGEIIGHQLGLDDFETASFVIGLLGRSWSAADYARAARYMQRWAREVGAFFANYDVLLTPTLAAPPIEIGALRPQPIERAILTIVGRLRLAGLLRVSGLANGLVKKPLSFIPHLPLFNVTGQPALSLPLHWNASGLPIGTQSVARMGEEATLFRLAGQLEQARPWFERTPPGC